jgi:hypothetical protein
MRGERTHAGRKGAIAALVTAPPPEAVVLYADQSEVGLYPPVGAQWSPRGQQAKIRTHGRNQKVYLFGALEAHREKLYVGFWPRKDSAACVEFLQTLLAAFPQGFIYLILDN